MRRKRGCRPLSIKKVSWNRIKDGLCVKCGDPLISPKDATMYMCTECLEDARQGAMKQIKNAKTRKDNVKKKYLVIAPQVVNE